MSSPITITGLGSGLDTQAIITALVKAESLPITALQSKKTDDQNKLSLLGTFQSLVATLHDQAISLSTMSGFLSNKAAISDPSTATVGADTTATTGAHTVIFQTLAAADRWSYSGVPDPTADLASADGQAISFSVGAKNYSFSFNQTSSSLNDIASQINLNAGNDVTASVVNAGTAATPSWQLVIASDTTGTAANVVNLTTDIAGLSGANNIVPGSDASAVIDGLTVKRSNNDFSGVIQGVSISALSADPNKTMTLTVSPDETAIKGKIQSFVDAYNGVISFISSQNTYDPTNGVGGPLFGDNVLQTIKNTINGALFGQSAAQVASDTTGYGTLRLVGLETQSDGTLKINDTVLTQKLSANLSAFADLFVDKDGFNNGGAAIGSSGYYTDITADHGLADTLWRSLDHITQTYQGPNNTFAKGIFDARTDALNAEIKSFDDQIANDQYRVDQYQSQLEAKFSALEATMAQLQSQQNFLTNGNPFGTSTLNGTSGKN